MTTRKSPGDQAGAIPKDNAGSGVRFSLTELDALALRIDGAFIVIAQVAAGRYHRRPYFTLRAAENAVRNANARGQSARIVLAQLKPAYIVQATAQLELGDDR